MHMTLNNGIWGKENLCDYQASITHGHITKLSGLVAVGTILLPAALAAGRATDKPPVSIHCAFAWCICEDDFDIPVILYFPMLTSDSYYLPMHSCPLFILSVF
jgi:hypothetical protein